MTPLPAPGLDHIAGLTRLTQSLFPGTGARHSERVEMSFFRVA